MTKTRTRLAPIVFDFPITIPGTETDCLYNLQKSNNIGERASQAILPYLSLLLASEKYSAYRRADICVVSFPVLCSPCNSPVLNILGIASNLSAGDPNLAFAMRTVKIIGGDKTCPRS